MLLKKWWEDERMPWNFGDILDANAPAVPGDKPALIHGDRVTTWRDFDTRTNALARGLMQRGHKADDKLAVLIRNRPEYMEATCAAFKGRFVHANVNYRYKAEELFYIFDNSDARIVVYGSEFAPVLADIRSRLPNVHTWLQVKVDATPVPSWALDYEKFLASHDGRPLGITRSGDDLFFLYTGGTTGMPKGVMWTHHDLRQVGLNPALMPRIPVDVPDHVKLMQELAPGQRFIPACPQMHGTGLLTSFATLMMGGTVITLEGETFDAVELWEVAAKHKATQIAIVGDAFAKPMLRALDENPGRWDLSALVMIISSGVMWSQEVKQGLVKHIPQVALLDSFGASEAVGFGMAVTTAAGEVATAKFMLGEDVAVFSADHKRIAPGSDEIGFIARGGNIPLGYWKDEAKTAKTFPVIEGRRWSIPGDFCRLHADGTLTLLGRGSVCINTAGEKVYPEEVEEILKQHPDVDDALVVGVPDEKWGQAVTGVVELKRGVRFDEEGLRKHVRTHLAGYKTPKRIVTVDRLFRAPNGKADYKMTTDYAKQALSIG
jgi:fatty-acyl-CoA synthase